MGLISPGEENLLDFLELRQVLSTYDGDLRDPLWWPQERPVPMQLLGGLSGFLSRRCRGLRSCVEWVLELEDSSPVLTWILGVLLESPQGSQSSSRVGACTCAFLPSCSSSVTLPFAWIKGSVSFPRGFHTKLSHEAFPRGFPSGLSHVTPWCESILGLKVEQCRENRFPWNGLRHLGTLGMWHDPGFPLAFPVGAPPLEMRLERREFFAEHAGK